MKILVRNKETFEYVKETGIYTPTQMEAVDFLSQELASDFCERHRLDNHEILTADEDE